MLNNFRCKWVKVDGDEYRVSAGVILNVVHDLPTVGIIQGIYIVNGVNWHFMWISFLPHMSHTIELTY